MCRLLSQCTRPASISALHNPPISCRWALDRSSILPLPPEMCQVTSHDHITHQSAPSTDDVRSRIPSNGPSILLLPQKTHVKPSHMTTSYFTHHTSKPTGEVHLTKDVRSGVAVNISRCVIGTCAVGQVFAQRFYFPVFLPVSKSCSEKRWGKTIRNETCPVYIFVSSGVIASYWQISTVYFYRVIAEAEGCLVPLNPNLKPSGSLCDCHVLICRSAEAISWLELR